MRVRLLLLGLMALSPSAARAQPAPLQPPAGVIRLVGLVASGDQVIYLETRSLSRLGDIVHGWTLELFKEPRLLEPGAPQVKGSWTRFSVDCKAATYGAYGFLGYADWPTVNAVPVVNALSIRAPIMRPIGGVAITEIAVASCNGTPPDKNDQTSLAATAAAAAAHFAPKPAP